MGPAIDVVLVRTEGALNLGSVARLCGNFGCAMPQSFAPRMREIIDKRDISERDVELLRGMLRVFSR